ncbi:MAG: peptidoglycan D,D-transpeptidase FtsI family protein [Chloroflexota bacterium]
MPGRTDPRLRHLVLLGLFALAVVTLLGRLAYWQVVERDRLVGLATAQTEQRLEQPSRRGTIYDRSGTVVLATTVERYRLVGSPSQLTPERRAAVAAELVRLLAFEGQAAAQLTAKMGSDKDYVVLARDIDGTTAATIRDQLAAGTLAGIDLESEPVRVYPQTGGAEGTTLAAHLLGFVNRDGVGQYGVEQRYQDVLAGQPQVAIAARDVGGRPIAGSERVLDPGTPGIDLRLTIDASLQLAVEQELLAAWVADRAASVSAVVIDPRTGAIYAEATYPSYDANDYASIAKSNPARFIDPVISQVYEPGSVFKMLTAVAGLTSGVVTPASKVNDSGTLALDGGRARINDADRRAMGWIRFEDVIAYSRNVGAARVAMALGKDTRSAAVVLHDTWTRLGFGQPTGVDLAGEVGGIVRDPTITGWRQIDLANGAFGQGVAVTPLQLATAYSAMVNGGSLVRPHVVAAVGDREVSPPPRGQVIEPAVARQLVGLMRHVVTEVPFYRDRTLVPGYVVGGKTGTAQIWDPKLNDWKQNVFNFSFVGFIGRQDPELVVAVQIREARPTVVRIGYQDMPVFSFELFRRIATDAITTLDLPPTPPTPPTTADR